MASLAGEKEDSQNPPPYTEEPTNMDDLLKRPVSKFNPPKLLSIPKNITLSVIGFDVNPQDKKRNFNEAFEDGEPEPVMQSEWEERMSYVFLKCCP